jgi:hypothetical protein
MKNKKLIVSEGVKQQLKEMRRILADVDLDDGVLNQIKVGGCGHYCMVTCSWHCESTCAESCLQSGGESQNGCAYKYVVPYPTLE